MTLALYWQTRLLCRDTVTGLVHLVVEHKDYTFSGGILACSVPYPFVTSDITSARVQRNFKDPDCERCLRLWQWVEINMLMRSITYQALGSK